MQLSHLRTSHTAKLSSLIALTSALITGTPRTAAADEVFKPDPSTLTTPFANGFDVQNKFKQDVTMKGIDPSLVQGLLTYDEILKQPKQVRRQWASDLLQSAYEKKSQNEIVLKKGVPSHYSSYLNACLGIPEREHAVSEPSFGPSVINLARVEAYHRSQAGWICGSYRYMHDVKTFLDFSDYQDYMNAQGRQSDRIVDVYSRFDQMIRGTNDFAKFPVKTMQDMTNSFARALLLDTNTPITFKKSGPLEDGTVEAKSGVYHLAVAAQTPYGNVSLTVIDANVSSSISVEMKEKRDLLMLEMIARSRR